MFPIKIQMIPKHQLKSAVHQHQLLLVALFFFFFFGWLLAGFLFVLWLAGCFSAFWEDESDVVGAIMSEKPMKTENNEVKIAWSDLRSLEKDDITSPGTGCTADTRYKHLTPRRCNPPRWACAHHSRCLSWCSMPKRPAHFKEACWWRRKGLRAWKDGWRSSGCARTYEHSLRWNEVFICFVTATSCCRQMSHGRLTTDTTAGGHRLVVCVTWPAESVWCW